MRGRFVSAAAAALFLTGHLPAAEADPQFEPLDAMIDRAIEEERIVGAVVMVARDGEIVYRRAAGLADREAGRPMREDAIFRLASVTKPIISATAMRLIEQGKLSLDDPVTRWLPHFRPPLPDGSTPPITVRQLLTHTAGLSYRFLEPSQSPYHRLNVSDGLDQPGLGLEENLRRLGQAPLAFPPGTGWRYSLATDVLGAVISRAAKQPLPELVRREITGPLGMRATGFVVTDLHLLVTPYFDSQPSPRRMENETVVSLWEGEVRFDPRRALDASSFPSGGAGMVGTAGDFVIFLEAIRKGGETILKPETVREMMADQVGTQAATQGPGWGFGYGWAVRVDPADADTPQSPGTIQWGGAYGHSWFVDPVRQLTVVAFTNVAFEGMAGAFTREIRDAVYGSIAGGSATGP